MRWKSLILLGFAGLATACSGQNEPQSSVCQRTEQEALSALQEVEISQACATKPGENLTVRLSDLPGDESERCTVAAVFVAPVGYETPRITFGAVTDEGRLVSASASVRDFLFADRLTNAAELRLSPDTNCAEISLRVQDLRCQASAGNGTEGQDCGSVVFEGTGMFAGFEPLAN